MGLCLMVLTAPLPLPSPPSLSDRAHTHTRLGGGRGTGRPARRVTGRADLRRADRARGRGREALARLAGREGRGSDGGARGGEGYEGRERKTEQEGTRVMKKEGMGARGDEGDGQT